MTDDKLRRVSGHREDQWQSRTLAKYQRLGVSESHTGHVAVEWAPIVQKPIDWTLWLLGNWHRVLLKSQRAAFRWLIHPKNILQAVVGGLNLAAWFTAVTWLIAQVIVHVV